MVSRYDLHSHSTASDGTLNPAELVARARAQGVEVLALTDHDTLDGIEAAALAAADTGLRLVPGVEVSVSWRRRTIHVLGLNVDPANPVLREGLSGLQAFRVWRGEEIARRLERSGIPDALEGARRHCRGAILGRTHFARFLVEAGHAASLREVFKRYLVRGRPGHVGGTWAGLEEAVGWIRGAGGLAVIAHPARYGLTRTKLGELIDDFRLAGGNGLEVVSGSHSRDQNLHMAALARTRGLYASCGSDYHGPENPWVELGRLPELPAGCVPVWQAGDWLAAA
ncbi:MAG TPA: PHP domain-containing protein [Gammaproteobacteria bacterium]|nr:PHP domain-containing protein [Gammaproteobacteria bacterium]